MKLSIFIPLLFISVSVYSEDKLSVAMEKAEKGDAAAQNRMGEIYQNGLEGVTRDENLAYSYFKKSAENGDINGQSNLGHVYLAGRGVKEDLVLGASWVLKAAERGSQYAQFNMGKCYQRGEGVPKDDAEAYKWYLLSAAQGNTLAKWCLEDLESKLSQSQREDGQKRAKEFSPKKSWCLFGK